MSKKNTINKNVGGELFGFSPRSYYNWRVSHYKYKEDPNKKENGVIKKHPIIELIEKYFTEEDIKEFIDTSKIEKYEYMDYLNYMDKNKFLEMAEKILYEHSDVARYILKLIQKYEKRYFDIKKKHQKAENKIQDYIRYGDDKEFIEIQEYPDGYLSLDEYFESIIFLPDKLSEILGEELPAGDLFEFQKAIKKIAEENLIPVIKRHMEYLFEKVESFKTEYEFREEYEEEEMRRMDEYYTNPNQCKIAEFEEKMIENYEVSDYIYALKEFGHETTNSLYSSYPDIDMIDEDYHRLDEDYYYLDDDSLERLLERIERLLELYYLNKKKLPYKEAWDKAVSIAKLNSIEDGVLDLSDFHQK